MDRKEEIENAFFELLKELGEAELEAFRKFHNLERLK